MKILKATFGPLLALTAMLVTLVPAMAEEATVTTAAVKETTQIRLSGTVITAPMISVDGLHGKTVVAQSRFPMQLTKYTAANGVTIFYVSPRDDMNMRRDDLLARVLIEQADGAISEGDSSQFVNRLVRIDELKAEAPADSNSRAYVEHVRGIYHRYDKLAQDLQSTSKLGDRQLAAAYEYHVY
jgi:hypothetical protein